MSSIYPTYNHYDLRLLVNLHRVAEQGDLRAVKHLINHGVLITEVNDDYRVPFDCAVMASQWEVAGELLRQGRRHWQLAHGVEGQPSVSDDAIMWAMKDVCAIDDLPFSPLEIVSRLGSDDMINRLILEQGCRVNGTKRFGNPLVAAIASGRPTTVSLLLSHQADPNVFDVRGEVPLMAALQQEDGRLNGALQQNTVEIVTSLLQAGARVPDPWTVSLLLKGGFVAVTRPNGQMHTFPQLTKGILHMCRDKKVTMVERFLDFYSTTQLVVTFCPGETSNSPVCKLVALLILTGNKPIDVRDNGGAGGAMLLALRVDFVPVFFLLAIAQPEALKNLVLMATGIEQIIDQQIPPAVDWMEDRQLIDCLARAGYSLPKPTVSYVLETRGWTLLHDACWRGDMEMIRRILSAEMDNENCPNQRRNLSRTALHVAVQKRRMQVVKLLVQQGADTKATTDAGLTPEQLAKKGGRTGILRVLKEGKIDVDEGEEGRGEEEGEEAGEEVGDEGGKEQEEEGGEEEGEEQE